MSSSKRPLASARGRATLLFACCLGTVLVYLMLARPDGTGVVDVGGRESGSPAQVVRSPMTGFGGKSDSVNGIGSVGSVGSADPVGSGSTSPGALQSALSSLLGSHTLLTGSVTDKIIENPQESLAALLEEQQRLKMAEAASKCGEDEDEERVDPLPGNITGRFHGSCRSQYPPTVPNLLVRQIWKSPKMRKMTDVTLVTHLTLDQLSKLEFQCERWSSRVAAAVYVKMPYPKTERDVGANDDSDGDVNSPDDDLNNGKSADAIEQPDDTLIHDTLVAAEKEVSAFFDKVHESQLPCTLDVLLAYEEYTPNDPWLLLYPINAMRNKALQLADAENVLVVDVDTVPNVDLSHDLHIMSLYETLNRVLGNRQVIVLPTLTVASSEEDDPLQTLRLVNRSLEGIDRLKVMNEKGKISTFQTVRSPLAQQDTNVAAWFNASMPYRLADVHEEYEPVYMAKKATLPWYDERFRGLKLNRCVEATEAGTVACGVSPTTLLLYALYATTLMYVSLTFPQYPGRCTLGTFTRQDSCLS